MSKQERKENWTESEKILGVIAIILVGGYFLFVGFQYSQFSVNFDEMPVGMANPTLSKQCAELVEEYTELKDFLGVDNFLTMEQIEEMAWSDYLHYVKLDMKIRELQCTLESDT